MLNQNQLMQELSSQENQYDDRQVVCNNSYLDFENQQLDVPQNKMQNKNNIHNIYNNNSNSNFLSKNTYLKSVKNKASREYKAEDIRKINNNFSENLKQANNQKYNSSSYKKNNGEDIHYNSYNPELDRKNKKFVVKEELADESTISKDYQTPIVTEQYYEIQHFLKMIYLEEYTQKMINNGFDDINILISQMKTKNAITDKILKDIGISVPGYRAKIIVKLEESNKIIIFVYKLI